MTRQRRGWDVMRRAILALFLRELKTRFGKYKLGYAWAVIEPLGLICILLVVFTSFRVPVYPGIDFPLFLATGVVLNSLFVEISVRSIKAIEANAALLSYRPIHPIDTVVARSLLELVTHACVYLLLSGLFLFLGGTIELHDLPQLILVFFLLAILASGLGILFMLITEAFSDADKVLPLLTRPLFYISGVFFSVQAISRDFWPLFLWNPIFHAIELARMAVAPGYVVEDISLAFLASSAFFSLTIGLVFYQRHERKFRFR